MKKSASKTLKPEIKVLFKIKSNSSKNAGTDPTTTSVDTMTGVFDTVFS